MALRSWSSGWRLRLQIYSSLILHGPLVDIYCTFPGGGGRFCLLFGGLAGGWLRIVVYSSRQVQAFEVTPLQFYFRIIFYVESMSR